MRKKRFPGPTAMTDIAFLLLLFFLILAVTTQALPLSLNPAESSASSLQEDPAYLVIVGSDGTLFYQGQAIKLTDLPHATEFSLLSDKETPFALLSPVIEALKERGVTTLHCIVEPNR